MALRAKSMGRRVIIIGSGIVGLCAALCLQRDGWDVVVVDPGDVRSAASFGNAGQIATTEVAPLAMPGVLSKIPGWLLDPLGPLSIRPSYLLHCAPWLLRLLRESTATAVAKIVEARARLCATAMADYGPLLAMTGSADLIEISHCVRVYRSEAEWPRDTPEWQLRARNGQADDRLAAAELREVEPELAKAYTFAMRFAGRRFVRNPGRLLQRFADEFGRRGGRIVAATAAGFDRKAGAVTGVTLSTGETLGGEWTIVAAGARSHRLARQLGDRVPLETERGYHVTVPGAQELARGVIVDGRSGIAIVPMEDGLRITGKVELAGLDAPPDPRQGERLLGSALRVLPRLRDFVGGASPLWMGHRPSLPDSLPLIDRAGRYRNVVYAFGHNHMGLTWGATTGRLVSDIVGGRAPGMDVAAFGLSRFVRPAPA